MNTSSSTTNKVKIATLRLARRIARRVRMALPPIVGEVVVYYIYHRRIPNFRNPERFSELVSLRRLHDHSAKLALTGGKIESKDYLNSLDLHSKVLPTIWFGTDLSQLETLELPKKWIAKPNNAWGSAGIVMGAGAITEGNLSELQEALKIDITNGNDNGAWAMKQCRTGVLIEPRIGDGIPIEYKVHVFNGHAEIVQARKAWIPEGPRDPSHVLERYFGHYDRNWNHFDVVQTLKGNEYPERDIFPKPARLNQLLTDAETIAQGYEYIRVDFLEDEDTDWVLELEPYPELASVNFDPDSFDFWMAQLWNGNHSEWHDFKQSTD